MRPGTAIDGLLGVGTVILAGVVIHMAVSSWAQDAAMTSVSARPPLYAEGERIPAVAGVNFAAFDRTLLVVMKSDCPFCIASSGFYRRLLDEQQTRRASVQVLFVAAEDDARFDESLRENGLPTGRTARMRGNSLKVRGTPTLLLIDRSSRVQTVWEGQVPASVEKQIVAATFGGR